MAEHLRPPRHLIITENIAEDWKIWIQQFQFYSKATKLDKQDEEIQAATLMTCMGIEAGKIFETFQLKKGEIKHEVIVKKFEEYFTPKKNVTYERYTFNKMSQMENENFDEFFTRIKTQVMRCDFENLTDELLRDKIVVGVCSNKIRERLLVDSDLTLKKAIDVCRSSESTSRQLSEINKKQNVNINVIKKPSSNKSNTTKQSTNDQRNKPSINNSETYFCKRCKTTHGKKSCLAYGKKCRICGKFGHLMITCYKNEKNYKKVNEINENVDNEVDEELYLYEVINREKYESAWFERIKIENNEVEFKLDTGAQCNVIDKKLADKLKLKIEASSTKKLIAFSGHKISVVGQVTIKTIIKNRSVQIKCKVVDDDTVPILGIKTCIELGLISRTDGNDVRLVQGFEIDEQVFNGLGCLKNYTYEIDLKANPDFVIVPPRRIPHAIRDDVKNELNNMTKLGVIKPIKEPTPIVSPMVVIKQKNKLRVCIDPSNINKNILRRHYPMKSLEEISARVKGSKVFTLLDCKRGFWQIKVSETTQKYLAFSTPWGRYTCLRLPFGLASAPEVFQQIMSQLLEDLTNVECSMDDILIHATSSEELENITKQVIQRITTAGLKLNKEKCLFNKTKLKFLGHIMSAEGLSPDDDKINVIGRIETPKNIKQLQRFLGMVTYVSKFIPNCSEMTAPLRELMKKNISFTWEHDQQQAFEKLKQSLSSAPVLKYFNVNADIKLSVDASQKAVGAVLMQEDHPVAYASKALTQAQQNYPQIEKEALAIKFACKKFHEYIYGKRLEIETDHKPLETIFKRTIEHAPQRLRRILFDVLQYAPNVIYKKGTEIPIADALSRDCITENEDSDEEELEVLIILPMSQDAQQQFKEDIKSDKNLSHVISYITYGWPDKENNIPYEIKHFTNFKEELAVYEGIIFKGDKIVVPNKQIQKILKTAHTGHLGIVSTVKRIRQLFYWKNLSKDVIEYVQKCAICQQTQRKNVKEPIINKQIPEYPWQRVATDLFTFESQDYIVIVDSYSGHIDFDQLKATTSGEIIKILKKSFAMHGTPEVLESDNGPQFSSREFKTFAEEWKFIQETSSPHFPRANGTAERAVQTAKSLLRKCSKDKTDIYKALQNLRNIPRNNELESPNQRLFSRITRTNLPINKNLLIPRTIRNVPDNLKQLRERQKFYADKGTKEAPDLNVNDKIRIQVGNREWIPGTVINKTQAPRSLLVETDDGRIFRRNKHHLAKTSAQIIPKIETVPDISHYTDNNDKEHGNNESNDHGQKQNNETNNIVTRSGRIVRPVSRLNL